MGVFVAIVFCCFFVIEYNLTFFGCSAHHSSEYHGLMNELKRKMDDVSLETRHSMEKMRKDIEKLHMQDTSAVLVELRLLKQENQALSSQLADVLQILRSRS